ncbi:BglII/BstYI family type II restriction endonuclease [Puerhibacterium puerhi]|uniref:BglII/BstYI family type II restriction endonuclease n=1 Tax=Puerhibacterium puerhi TaxID=2692623 RepID=UPI0013574293|nr:BglII/BstYI family type II restriction endonuclease [Puerhibacterium puerhi]
MLLTESWRDAFPIEIQARYDFAETRNAAAILKTLNPGAFADLVNVLQAFSLSVDLLVRPGGNKSKIAAELDCAFRQRGYREARFEQDVTTRLVISAWGTEPAEIRETSNSYGGHKVDNVKDRAVVDVEWNPKDGNLDRDFANYVSLHEGGVIDVGVIVTRRGGDFRYFVRDLVAQVRAIEVPDATEAWTKRMKKTPADPLGTSTTSNFEKLVERLERGDARGCPLLAVAIGEQTFDAPDDLFDEVRHLAQENIVVTSDGLDVAVDAEDE